MESLYQEYQDVAEFALVYIREAHAADGRSPTPLAKKLGITEHLNADQRCQTAQQMMADQKLTIPCYADLMDDRINEAYAAWPDRIYVIRADGRIALAAAPGPRGFEPALQATQKWLAELKATGQEPALPATAAPPGSEREIPAKVQDK